MKKIIKCPKCNKRLFLELTHNEKKDVFCKCGEDFYYTLCKPYKRPEFADAIFLKYMEQVEEF